MNNHAPKDYICPICLGVKGIESDQTLIRRSDIVYQDESVTAFISSFFIGNNPGHVIIVPNNHFENLYDLPEEIGIKIIKLSQRIALVIKKAYLAEGITILQNNEPAGNQHAYHYHMHIFPRYENDDLHKHILEKKTTTFEERQPFAQKIKVRLAS